jgi:phosphoenolpyruvate carboxykinase (ATP)
MLNTGWVAGGYGKSDRISIKHTRALLNAALEGKLEGTEFVNDQRFGFDVPTEVPGVPSDILLPRNTWADGAAYDETADHLACLFNRNFEKFEERVSDAVLASAPHELHREIHMTTSILDKKDEIEGVIRLHDEIKAGQRG